MLANYAIKIDNVNNMGASKTLLVSRHKELERLDRFLDNPSGGSVLIGGDRGSGKTTLVKLAVKNIDTRKGIAGKLKNIRSLTMSRMVVIDIPLIIINKPEDRTLNEQYRSILMRAMLAGMEADLLRRYTKHYRLVDLPQRWFRSIGYIQKLHALHPYAHYLKLSKTTSRALTASTAGLSPALTNALTAEIDLSDSSLEIKLRDLLTQYSSVHKFIFVFDELDKLPDSIKVEELVLYLKNLFSETGAYGIFISDEKTLKRVINKANEVPPTESTTLFLDHILLNNMTREEFSAVVNSRVDTPEENINEMLATLALRTRRSPHELTKALMRHGVKYEKLIQGLRIELGRTRFSRSGVMQHFIDHVYNKFSGTYDSYYDRELSQFLEEAGDILLNHRTQYVEFEWARTLFYTTDLFKSEEAGAESPATRELGYKASNDTDIRPTRVPDLIARLNALTHGEQDRSIQNAIEYLITLLNKSGLLYVSLVPKHPGVLKLGTIPDLNFTYDHVNNLDLAKVVELSEEKRSLVKRVRAYSKAHRGITGQELYHPLKPINLQYIENVDKWGNKYCFSNLVPLWELMNNINDGAHEKILSAVMDKLSPLLDKPLDSVRYSGKSVYISSGKLKEVQIMVLFENQKATVSSTSDKTFILRDTSANTKLAHPSKKVRNMRMSSSWQNITSSTRSMSAWINKNA